MCIAHLSVLLNRPSLPTNWYNDYGLTQDRANALARSGRKANSLHHPKSETALTLFMLGNLDRWHQVGTCDPAPRDASSKWSPAFFSLVRGNGFRLLQPRPANGGLAAILMRIMPGTIPDLANAVLMFEFEVLNTAFHPIRNDVRKPFKGLSFLNIEKQGVWSQFDAFLIVPLVERGVFIFVEAKLTSDISQSTAAFPLVNQVARNLESAYLLTHHDDSLYKGWDFHYVFVCPRKMIEYKTTYYAYAVGERGQNVTELIRSYGHLLEVEYRRDRSETICEKHFDEFKRTAPERTHVIYWDELAAELAGPDHAFWTEYRDMLTGTVGLDPAISRAVLARLACAGIDCA